MSRAAIILALAAALTAATGCRPPLPRVPQVQTPAKLRVELPKPTSFEIDDNQGNRVMDATSRSAGGTITPGKGKGPQAVGNGPFEMAAPDCLMYKKGKPDLRITAPRAVWKDAVLTAEGGVHLDTIDGGLKAVCDHATWANEI